VVHRAPLPAVTATCSRSYGAPHNRVREVHESVEQREPGAPSAPFPRGSYSSWSSLPRVHRLAPRGESNQSTEQQRDIRHVLSHLRRFGSPAARTNGRPSAGCRASLPSLGCDTVRILCKKELKTVQNRGITTQRGVGASKYHRNGVKTRENDPPNFFFFSPFFSSPSPSSPVRDSVPTVNLARRRRAGAIYWSRHHLRLRFCK
jgi:hypothetical protein